MIKKTLIAAILAFFVSCHLLHGQEVELRNKIRIVVRASIMRLLNDVTYSYALSSLLESQQKVWQFWVIFKVPKDSVKNVSTISGWRVATPEVERTVSIRWGSPGSADISPGESRGGFIVESIMPAGVVDYYAEGYAPPPAWEGSVAEDTIPGYDDLTPYGPGIVGKTVGPFLPPDPFASLNFLDTLLSYTRQSAALGWLGRDRDDDCDDDERPDDGVVRNIENRLQKARRELVRGDSVKARRELVKLVRKVDRLHRRGERVMTSEAYALLKYNTEYLIERLPERRRR